MCSFFSFKTKRCYFDDDKLKNYINNLREKKLQKNIIIPLFEQNGFELVHKIKHTDDKNTDFGADIIMKKSVLPQIDVYCGIQLKTEEIHKNSSKDSNNHVAPLLENLIRGRNKINNLNSVVTILEELLKFTQNILGYNLKENETPKGINKIVNQLLESLNYPIPDNLRNKMVDFIILISSNNITTPAREYLKKVLIKDSRRLIYFIDIDDLIAMIKKTTEFYEYLIRIINALE